MKLLRFLLMIGGIMLLSVAGIIGVARAGDPSAHVVYFWSHSEFSPQSQLLITTPDGAISHRLLQYPLLNRSIGLVSPDQQWIYFSAHPSPFAPTEIYRVHTTGRSVQRLTVAALSYEEPLAWSPDGQWLLFGTDRDLNTELYRMRADGSQVQNLTRLSSDNRFAAWSPDGEWLYFTVGGARVQLYRMHPDGSNQENVTRNAGYNTFGAFSPDGEWMFFTLAHDSRNTIYQMRLDGSQMQRLTPPTRSERFIGLTPDGGWLMVASISGEVVSLERRPMQGDAAPQLIAANMGGFSPIGWLPDQQTFVGYRSDNGRLQLSSVLAESGHLARLDMAGGSDWFGGTSPDGQWLYFTSGRTGRNEVYRMRSNGTHSENLTRRPATDDQYFATLPFVGKSAQWGWLTAAGMGIIILGLWCIHRAPLQHRLEAA